MRLLIVQCGIRIIPRWDQISLGNDVEPDDRWYGICVGALFKEREKVENNDAKLNIHILLNHSSIRVPKYV